MKLALAQARPLSFAFCDPEPVAPILHGLPRRTSTQPCGTGFYAITGSSGTGSRAQPQRQNSARWSPRQRACISDARLPLTHELMPWMPRVGGYGKRTVVLFPIPLLFGIRVYKRHSAGCLLFLIIVHSPSNRLHLDFTLLSPAQNSQDAAITNFNG